MKNSQSQIKISGGINGNRRIDSEIRSIITKCFKKSQSFDVSAKLADMKKRLKTLNEADLEWLFNLSDEIS